MLLGLQAEGTQARRGARLCGQVQAVEAGQVLHVEGPHCTAGGCQVARSGRRGRSLPLLQHRHGRVQAGLLQEVGKVSRNL